MDELRVARAAGILEGEGSFLTKTGGFAPVVTCQMTDLDVLEELQSVFGGTIHAVTKREEHWKDAWAWRVSGTDAAKAMQKVRPYMFSRRKETLDRVLKVWLDKQDSRERQSELVQIAAVAYLNGEGSYRELAKKFGISYETIRRRVWEID